MSFKTNLMAHIREYKPLSVSYGGVTREISIPYYISGQIPGVSGGKNTPAKIKQFILEDSSNFTNGILNSQSALQTFVNIESNKPSTGIDCSGFAYYILNEASGGLVMAQFNNTTYSNGVSAASLCSTSNGVQKLKAKDIVPGCTIYLQGSYNHVMVVAEVIKNASGVVTQITFYHSIYKSSNKNGPSTGYITISDENADLNGSSQTWLDTFESGSVLKSMYKRTTLLNSIKNLV